MRNKSFRREGFLCLAGWLLFAILTSYLLLVGRRSEAPPETTAAVLWMVWVGSAALVLLVAAPGWLHRRRLERRIRQILAFSQNLAAGEFEPFPSAPHEDGLDAVVEALNAVGELKENSVRLLTEERNRSDAILRSMVEGVAVIEPGQKITFCNEAFCRALGLVGVPCAGRLLVELTRQSGLLELFQQALGGGETVRGEVEIETRSPRIFAVTAAPLLTGGGPAVVLVLHDITELRKLERARRDFVANVSHEFKTPLTAIQGFAETLLGGALEDTRNSTRFLEIIRDHAIRLSRLTNDMLKLSLIEAGRLQLERRPVAVAEWVESCLDTVRPKAQQREIALRAECAARLPAVVGDSNRLKEALLNLLDNALQYTPPGGAVTVRAAETDGEVIVSVSDTGIGIPKADQARIFERFYRVDDARSREVGGTGLGLSIAKHLIEAHDGRIELESSPGTGSTFCIILPSQASPSS